MEVRDFHDLIHLAGRSHREPGGSLTQSRRAGGSDKVVPVLHHVSLCILLLLGELYRQAVLVQDEGEVVPVD